MTAALVVVVSAGCQPRTAAKDRPVIFVHGWSALGTGIDCDGSFGALEERLRSEGFTGPFVSVAFYDTDRNCDVDLRSWGPITNSSPWRDIAKAFSNYVHQTFTSQAIAVDIVGHSMGGNIARGAVLGTSRGEVGFSGPLLVQDAVTIGAPHQGAAWYSNLCLWGQCSGLKPGAADIAWLNEVGDPQGFGGTEWTVVGSDSDDVVPPDSALAMAVPEARKVRYPSLEHSDYQRDATSQARIAQALAEPNA
jgi:hypothetical protein